VTRRPTGSEWRAFRAALVAAAREDNPLLAVSGVLDLLAVCGASNVEREALGKLQIVVADLLEGRQQSALLPQPKRRRGKPKVSYAAEEQRAIACALAELYQQRDGVPLRAACARAARVLRHMPEMREARTPAIAIAKWREAAAEDVSRRTALRLILDKFRARIAVHAPRKMEAAFVAMARRYVKNPE